MKFFIYLFYNYYNSGGKWKEFAYEKAIVGILVILLFNILAILRLFDFDSVLRLYDIPFISDPLLKRIIDLVIFCPFYFILKFIFKRDVIINLKYDEETIRRGNRYLIIYLVGSLLTLMLVFASKGPMK